MNIMKHLVSISKVKVYGISTKTTLFYGLIPQLRRLLIEFRHGGLALAEIVELAGMSCSFACLC